MYMGRAKLQLELRVSHLQFGDRTKFNMQATIIVGLAAIVGILINVKRL